MFFLAQFKIIQNILMVLNEQIKAKMVVKEKFKNRFKYSDSYEEKVKKKEYELVMQKNIQMEAVIQLIR